jgi:hypothetical protein
MLRPFQDVFGFYVGDLPRDVPKNANGRHSSRIGHMVLEVGLEPTTSCLQGR